MGQLSRLRLALLALCAVLVVGTIGYVVLGFSVLEALYQTVTTVTTVGFREVRPLTPAGQVFTIALILTGVGTALYTLGVLLEALIGGELRKHVGRRRMDKTISRMTGHTIVCGWGRVGLSSAHYLVGTGQHVVVVDRDPPGCRTCEYPTVLGDVTDDQVLAAAGIDRARALIAALDTDADNVYVTLSARALRPDLVIIARARSGSSTSKLLRAGADRVVNPQRIAAAEWPHSPCNPTLPNSSTSSCTTRASTTGSNRSRSAQAPLFWAEPCTTRRSAARPERCCSPCAAPAARSSPTPTRTHRSRHTPSSSCSARPASSQRYASAPVRPDPHDRS